MGELRFETLGYAKGGTFPVGARHAGDPMPNSAMDNWTGT